MDTSDLEKRYRQLRSSYETYAHRVAELLRDLVATEGIPTAQMESRAKTVESFLGKLKRNAYEDPFTEIKDFAGVRIVTYYNDDVNRIVSLVHREFDVDPAHSTDKSEELSIDEFGYRSFHIVCSLGKKRSALTEWSKFSKLAVEIQIRSALQHAWAIISHKLDYKTARQAPKELRRKLFRLSALLELADEEFFNIRNNSSAITEHYKSDLEKGRLKIPFDIDSLSEYLRDAVNLTEWEKLGIHAGMIEPIPNPGEFDRAVEDLFNLLQHLAVSTIADVDRLLRKHKDKAKPILAALNDKVGKSGKSMEAFSLNVILAVLMVCERHRLPPDVGFPRRYRREICSAIDELLSSGIDDV